MTYQEWCVEHKCEHAHCPWKCEHPQPFIYEGKLYCGKCYHDSGGTILMEMEPCTPNVCD